MRVVDADSIDVKIAPRDVQSRFIREIPRAKYVPSPKLLSHFESDRHSFISILRRGPDKDGEHLPRTISFNFAVWITLNKHLTNPVSLLLHCKERQEEFYLQIDETVAVESDTIMLSGSVCLHPNSPIEFIKLCSSGISNDCNIYIDSLHIDSQLKMPYGSMHRPATWAR